MWSWGLSKLSFIGSDLELTPTVDGSEIPRPTTWDVWSSVNNGIDLNYLATGAGFLPSTVCFWDLPQVAYLFCLQGHVAVDNRPRYQQCLGENFVQDLGWTMDPEDVFSYWKWWYSDIPASDLLVYQRVLLEALFLNFPGNSRMLLGSRPIWS